MEKKRVFSGVQPSGNLTIANYLGAIKNFSKLQNEYDCFFSIVDMHSITVPQNPKDLRRRTLEVSRGGGRGSPGAASPPPPPPAGRPAPARAPAAPGRGR